MRYIKLIRTLEKIIYPFCVDIVQSIAEHNFFMKVLISYCRAEKVKGLKPHSGVLVFCCLVYKVKEQGTTPAVLKPQSGVFIPRFAALKQLCWIIIALVTITCMPSCNRQVLTIHKSTGMVKRSITVNNRTYSYYVSLPSQYTSLKKWPVILYFHGSGQNAGSWRSSAGLGHALKRYPQRYPFIVVFPECPMTAYWMGDMITYAVGALDQTVREFNGDSTRLYSSGVSMGGYGVWISAVRYPGKFAALAPACGGVVPPVHMTPDDYIRMGPRCEEILKSDDPYTALAEQVDKTPAWIFHGRFDTAVPVSESQKIVAALKKLGASVRYTEYETLGHDIWDIVYLEPELPSWLLSQKLNK